MPDVAPDARAIAEREGWTWCPRCQMLVPDPIYAEFCEPMEDAE